MMLHYKKYNYCTSKDMKNFSTAEDGESRARFTPRVGGAGSRNGNTKYDVLVFISYTPTFYNSNKLYRTVMCRCGWNKLTTTRTRLCRPFLLTITWLSKEIDRQCLHVKRPHTEGHLTTDWCSSTSYLCYGGSVNTSATIMDRGDRDGIKGILLTTWTVLYQLC